MSRSSFTANLLGQCSEIFMIKAIVHNDKKYKIKDKFPFENMWINYCITDPKSLLNVNLCNYIAT